MSRRVLFLSRDTGSVQAIAPVARRFAGEPGFESHIVSMAVSRGVLDAMDLAHEPLDEAEFAARPSHCVARLLDRLRPALVVSGSSPARGPAPETPEQHVLIEARRRGIATLGVLDAWLLHSERFAREPLGRADDALVPDTLCVLDRPCLDRLCEIGVPLARMRVTHNPWLDQAVRRSAGGAIARSSALGGGLNVLFVSQPLAQMQALRGWPYTQHELFRLLLDALPPAPAERAHRVLVWRHPTEPAQAWAGAAQAGRSGVAVSVTEERGDRILAHVDLMVSSHSTVAYEALHHATPCVSLRPAGEALQPLISDELGLTTVFHAPAAFAAFLQGFDPGASRAALRRRRDELVQRKIFFSDGHATPRVMAEAMALLSA